MADPKTKSGGSNIPAINLDEFRHDTETKEEIWTTSLHLYIRHMEFVRDGNINLSKLVRKILDEMGAKK